MFMLHIKGIILLRTLLLSTHEIQKRELNIRNTGIPGRGLFSSKLGLRCGALAEALVFLKERIPFIRTPMFAVL